MHARIQIYWCRSSIFRHLKLELLTQFPASNDEKKHNCSIYLTKICVILWLRSLTNDDEISVMYGSEKVNPVCAKHDYSRF